ncbi:MAG: hypothetical protein CVU48_09835 [Candidatus Cloacimonetes bacterium HGW-Cloacimonetes-1]|nr:MAG: hypothetical protein CVU48_09835 [Candidatus Cloacimonetes bacterium HGW-Cloacimonetes-1]
MRSSFSAYSIFQAMHDNNIQFSYKGPLTQDILTSFGESIKEKLHTDDCDEKVIRRIFSILVESAQNILKYSTDRLEVDAVTRKDAGVGIIGIGNLTDKEFLVFSGNLINADSMPRIKALIDHLNSLTAAELSLHYQKQLKEGTIAADGSAGLGWIEIARKANRPLEYEFVELSPGEIFFEIKIYIRVED